MSSYIRESDGKTITLAEGQKIAEGGEGAIYRSGQKYLAKIFFDPTPEKEDKVRQLQANWKSLVPAHINPPLWAFPIDTLLDQQTGKFVGYLMDRVTNSWPVGYTYNARKIESSQLCLGVKSLAIVMRNMWEVVKVSHALGIILSDITPANFMFTRKGRVVAIDTDSVQLKSGSRVFASGIGTLGYLAPEIARGRDLNVPRFWYHDVFSAACVSYQVMTGGWHFTDGKVSSHNGSRIPSLAERTQLCLWPHSTMVAKSGYLIEAPRDLVDFSIFSEELQKLFRWTFDVPDPEKRPTPKMWRDAFTRFACRLQICKAGLHEVFYAGRDCPWCKLENRSS